MSVFFVHAFLFFHWRSTFIVPLLFTEPRYFFFQLKFCAFCRLAAARAPKIDRKNLRFGFEIFFRKLWKHAAFVRKTQPSVERKIPSWFGAFWEKAKKLFNNREIKKKANKQMIRKDENFKIWRKRWSLKTPTFFEGRWQFNPCG